jgi:DNA-binding IclR family transcriptional regulator
VGGGTPSYTTTDGKTIGAVGRTLDVVEYLREHGVATPSTVAAELDVSKSTAHRHL